MVSEYSWETNTWTHTGDTTARPAWRAAVAEIAAKAKQTLPDCAGRVEAAVKLALAGDVELLPEGKAQVASQSNGTTVYHVVNGACTCRDFPKAPSGWCKHHIAAGLYKRAQALVQRQHDAGATAQAEPSTPAAQPAPAPDGPAAALPEAPVSITLKATLQTTSQDPLHQCEVRMIVSDDATPLISNHREPLILGDCCLNFAPA